MENVTFQEFDTDDEKLRVINRVIDNLNLVEGKVLQLVAEKTAKKPSGKTKKGFANMKIFLLVFVMLFATNAFAYVATDINYDIASNPETLQQYLRDTIGTGTFAFTPQSAPTAGSISQGLVYFDSSVNLLKVSLDGSSFATIDTAGGVSLDSAYDFGSAGGGRTILATDGAVQLTNSDNDTASILGVTYSGTNTGDGITITMSNGSGDAIEIENTGSGSDIEGTGATWTISKAGAFVGVGGTWSGDHLFTGSSKNIEVDVSQNAIHFLDDAILAIGGATTAAGDFTFAYDATDLNMEAAAANDDFRMGETTHFDFSIHGETNTNVVKFDTDNSALLCIFDGFDLRMNDDDVIIFGDSVASDSFSAYFDETTDNLLIVANTANDQVQFGDATSSSTDVKMMANTDGDFVLFDSSADELFFEDADLKLNEGAQLEFAWSDNATDWTADLSTEEVLTWLPTETDDTQSFNIGNATRTSDFALFGLSASTVLFDASADLVTYVDYDVLYDDETILFFGTGSDFSMYSDTADTLEIDPGAAGDTLKLGTSDTDALNIIWYADVSGDTVTFDEENKMVEFEDVAIALGDSTLILLGDTIGTGDIKIYASGTELVIDGVVAETGTVSIGLTDLGIDFKLWAATNAEGVLWDASDEALEFTGANITMDAASTLAIGRSTNADFVITDQASVTLTAAMSGKILVIGDLGQNTTIDLPVEVDGMNFEFWYVGAATETHDHIIDAEANANFFIGGIQFIDSDDNTITEVYSNGSSNSKLTLNNLEAGSIVKITCDGTNWYIWSVIYSDTAPVFANSV